MTLEVCTTPRRLKKKRYLIIPKGFNCYDFILPIEAMDLHYKLGMKGITAVLVYQEVTPNTTLLRWYVDNKRIAERWYDENGTKRLRGWVENESRKLHEHLENMQAAAWLKYVAKEK